ncbi:hypothetical protein ACQBAU_11205 [Propionibacteriaceae bacterium Y2011]|uniref:hypothetical protein n=1 Tax=Microlunatus sp. Y2014 TaxID=3418488 RepID=UPI003B48EFA3
MSTLTFPAATPTRPRTALTAMYVGLGLTVLALALPFLDRATGQLLAGHIRAGYPGYSVAEIETAALVYLIILATVGGVGILGWLSAVWTARRGHRWAARILASTLWLGATTVALFALTVTDTSGDTGLPPLFGWAGVIPCLAGLVAVVALWRRG